MINKETKYHELYPKIEAVLTDTDDLISAMASVSSLIKEAFQDFLWVGFYRLVGEELLVAPYQGALGCVSIHIERGVCGYCARTKESVIVPDVHKFDGHIACDSRANSEIVIPVFDEYRELIAVLDIDSAELSKFDETDREHLEKIVKLLANKIILA